MNNDAWARLCLIAAIVLLKHSDDENVKELHKRLREYEILVRSKKNGIR